MRDLDRVGMIWDVRPRREDRTILDELKMNFDAQKEDTQQSMDWDGDDKIVDESESWVNELEDTRKAGGSTEMSGLLNVPLFSGEGSRVQTLSPAFDDTAYDMMGALDDGASAAMLPLVGFAEKRNSDTDSPPDQSSSKKITIDKDLDTALEARLDLIETRQKMTNVNRNSAWDQKMKDLAKFQTKHGHTAVPNRYKEDPSLGRWVKNLRWEYMRKRRGEKTRLTDARITLLNDMGFVWVYKEVSGNIDDVWLQRVEDLKKFKDENGHTLVPNKYKPNPPLGSWVKSQRYEYKKYKRYNGKRTTMSRDRIRILEEVGFCWIVASSGEDLTGKELWDKRYNELKEFMQKTGHCNIPKNYPPNQSLGNWVVTQRKCYWKYSLLCMLTIMFAP